MLWSFLLWIVVGGVAGWIAASVMHAQTRLWTNVLLGIVGAVLGGFLFGLLGLPTATFWWGLFAAVVGAVVLIAIVRAVSHPKAATTTMPTS
jgi:uncharacterized membrane protein YeaQ/YmgE (transglycosylase-associated protein family)